jgi:hypothetical protein
VAAQGGQAPYPGVPDTVERQQLGESESGEYSQSGSSYDSQSSEELSVRENRVLTFQDEHGDPLCEYGFYEDKKQNGASEGNAGGAEGGKDGGGCGCAIS